MGATDLRSMEGAGSNQSNFADLIGAKKSTDLGMLAPKPSGAR